MIRRWTKFPWRWLLALFLGLGAASPAPAQTPSPAEEILGLVPEDMGLCLVVKDLRDHWQKIQQTAWFKALEKSPFGKTLVYGPEKAQFAKFEEILSKHLQITWPQLRDDLLGDA